MVENGIRQKITQEVYQKFPQYDPMAKDRLIKVGMAEYKRYNQKEIKKQIQDLYSQLKDRFQDESGQTYLMELDCWHWARYVENVFYLGHPGDKVKDSRQWDRLMLSPKGDYLAWNQFLFYFSAFLYRGFSLFKSVPLFTFVFYLPIVFASVFILVLYLFVRQTSSSLGAVVSCLFIGLSPIFLPRSCAGWFDMDILNLLFPFLIVWTYLKAHTAVSWKLKFFWIGFSAFWMNLFCYTWVKWWFILLIIIIYEIFSQALMVFINFRHKTKDSGLMKERAATLSFFLVCSLFLIAIFSGWQPFGVFYREFTGALALNKPLIPSIWPNVFSTVAELRKVDLREIANSTGGIFISVAALFCMIVFLIQVLMGRKYTGLRREAIIILAFWFLSMLYATLMGVRFTVFLLVPLGIFLGWAISDIYQYLKNRGKKYSIPAISLVFILCFIFTERANRVAKNIYPLMNDAWYKVLTLMKDTTPQNSTINSWWDFGDWFKVVAMRPVIFDGQTQNVPQAYWMARAILSTNENEALGILRMLNNAGNQAFEIIDAYLNDPLQSVLLLETIIPLPSGQAKEILLDFLPQQAADKVVILLFDKPENAYFIVDPSMIAKMSAISYLGNWNFSKVYIVQNFNKKEKEQILEHLEKLGKDKAEIRKFYQEVFLIPAKNLESWISRPYQFYSGLVPGRQSDGMIYFDNGFVYNPKEQLIKSNNGQIPRSLFLATGNNIVEKFYPDANLIFSILVFENQEGYKAVLLDRELANSLFVKLYFLKGRTLDHFKLHIDAQEGSEFIGSYKIDW